jgi:chemotaxis signal transduction protein
MIAETQSSGANSYVLMQIGNRRFGIPAGIVTELAPPVRLHNFPHSSSLVAGVIVRRGRIIPIYEVAKILLGRSSSAHQFYLIARRNFAVGGAHSESSEPSAIPVNGQCELATGELQPPGEQRPPYVSGTLAIDGESIEVLNLDSLLASYSAEASSHNPAPEAQS